MHDRPATQALGISWWPRKPTDRGPTEGNHRLTALTGSMLALLLALIFLTGLFMDAWWHVHYVVGFVLIPVVALKMASTGYRAMRYYTGDAVYQAAGPPELLQRVLAPIMIVSVLTALTTGVVLFAQHSRAGLLSTLHTDAAVASALLVGIHVLTYGIDAVAASGHELIGVRRSSQSSARVTIAGAVLLIGIVLAVVTYAYGTWPARPFDRRFGVGVSSVQRPSIATGGLAATPPAQNAA